MPSSSRTLVQQLAIDELVLGRPQLRRWLHPANGQRIALPLDGSGRDKALAMAEYMIDFLDTEMLRQRQVPQIGESLPDFEPWPNGSGTNRPRWERRLTAVKGSLDCELPTAQQLIGAHAQAVLDQAGRLCDLPAGWNGADAARVDNAAAVIAVEVVMKVTCPECLAPVLSPTLDGHVLLDWTYGDDHVEIEVFPDGRLAVLVDMPEFRDHEFVTKADNDAHLAWLAHQITSVGLSRFALPA